MVGVYRRNGLGAGFLLMLLAMADAIYAQYGGYTGPGRCVSGCNILTPPSGGASGASVQTIDDEAERRASDEAERQRAETERREQERRKAEQQREFERKRNEAAKLLKGGGNTGAFGNLKGPDAATSGLRAPIERIDRDIGGQQGWKQLHCAASILGPALAAAIPAAGKEPDFAESHYLLGEAQNALNGQRMGVECSPAPLLPQISGRAPDMERAVKNQRQMIVRASAAIDQLEQAMRARTPDEERIARAYAQQQANEAVHESRIAPIREQQRQINREREKKPGATSPPPAALEAQAKRELEAIAAENNRIKEANPAKMIDAIGWLEAPRRRPGTQGN